MTVGNTVGALAAPPPTSRGISLMRIMSMKATRRFAPWALALVATGAAHASPISFDELMQQLAEHPRFSADFSEERSSFFLSRPIMLEGRIRFDAEKSLEKMVERPFSEHIIINSDEVLIHRVNEEGRAATTQTTRYALHNYPFLAKAVRGVSNVFAGDKTLLEELYNWKLEGAEDNWELLLEPKGEKLAEFITSITIRGSGGLIGYIHSLEADGDESKLTLTNRTEP